MIVNVQGNYDILFCYLDKGELEAHDDPTFVKCPETCNNEPPHNSVSCEEQVSMRDNSAPVIHSFFYWHS